MKKIDKNQRQTNCFEKLLRKRLFEEIEKKYQKLLHKNPLDYLGLTYKGKLLQLKNKFSKSKRILKKAIKLKPEKTIAYHFMGTLKIKERKFERALEYFENVLLIDPFFISSKIQIAFVFLLKKDYEKALKIIEEAKKIDPNHPMIWRQLGNIQIEQNNYEEGEESLRKSLELGPECVDVYISLANLLKIKGNIQGSLDLHEKALEINPKAPKIINSLGSLYLRKREYTLAEKHFKKVIEKNSYFVLGYLNLGIIRRIQGKLDEALDLLDLVEKENPFNPTVWIFRGNIYLDKKMYDRSRECYERAINIYPYYVNGYETLSNLYQIQKNFDKSEEIYNKGIQKCGESSELFNLLANHYKQKKEYDMAKSLYKKSIQLDKYNFIPFHNLGCLYKQKKQFDKAIESFDKSLEINRYSMATLNNKGGVYLDQKDYEKAKQIYLKIINLDPFYSYSYINLGNICKAFLQYDNAMDFFEKGLKIKPNHMSTLNSKAFCLFSMGKYKEAIIGFQKLLELDDKDKLHYCNVGRCFLNMGDLEKALEWINKGIEQDPKDGVVKFWKGHALLKLKRDFEFKELIKKMIKEGEGEPNDLNKNLLKGYKLQLMYMKSRKQYSTALEICDKILEINELKIDTLVKKMYMLNERRQSNKVLSMAEKLLKKFPKNLNILFQMGLAANIVKNYHKGRDCFEEVIKFSPNHISALKNLQVAYHYTNQSFEKLQILNKLKKMQIFLGSHINKEIKTIKEIISRGEFLKIEEKVEGITPQAEDHPYVAKEIEEINKLEIKSPSLDNLQEFAINCYNQICTQCRLRILNKYRSKKKFHKVKEKYKMLLDSFRLKKKKLKKQINLFSLKVEKMSDENAKLQRLIKKNPKNNKILKLYFFLFRPKKKIKEEFEAFSIALQIQKFLKDFIRHSLKLDTIVTESHIFGRRHFREEGFNVKSRFHYDFFDQPLLYQADLLKNNGKYFEYFMKPIQNFPGKVSEFDLARKYWICFKELSGIEFIEVLFYLLNERSIRKLFIPDQNRLYGSNYSLMLIIEEAMTGHYSFDFDLSCFGGYLAFLIFEKLCGIVERCFIEQKSGAELTQLLGEEVLFNEHGCKFRRFKLKRINLSNKYKCKKISFESFEPQLKGLENTIEISVSDTQNIQINCQGETTKKLRLNLKCSTLFGKKSKRYVLVYEGHDSLFKPSVYRLDLDIWIDNDKEKKLEIWRTFYIKQKQIKIPKGIIKMYLKRIP